MPVLVGTSGWQYRDWRGRLYPQGLAQARWLEEQLGWSPVRASEDVLSRRVWTDDYVNLFGSLQRSMFDTPELQALRNQ